MDTLARPRRRATKASTRAANDALLDAAGSATVQDLLELARLAPTEALHRLGSSELGLSEHEATARLADHGINQFPTSQVRSWPARLWSSVRSPFVVLLVVLGAVVAVTGDPIGVVVIATMVIASLALRLHHERRFDHLLVCLNDLAAPRVTVRRRAGRHGRMGPVDRAGNPRLLVPGDLIVLVTGDVVPADCRIVHADDFALDQAVLTGESMPVAKYTINPGASWPRRLGQPDNRSTTEPDVLTSPTLCLTGTAVASGRATAVVAKTGPQTVLGATTRQLASPRRPTNADLGLRNVTWLLIRLLCALVPAVFAITVFTHHATDPAHAALYAVAVAVGLIPEMLPVILAAAHGRGLSALARQRIIATRPAAVQDLAGMDVLCTDKTGTLTLGRPTLARWVAPDGGPSREVLDYALLGAAFTDRRDPLDTAILEHGSPLDDEIIHAQYDSSVELGFDSTRRRSSVILDPGTGAHLMVTKGAVADVLAVTTRVRVAGDDRTLNDSRRAEIDQVCRRLWADGLRLLAIGYRCIDDDSIDIDNDPIDDPQTGWEDDLTLVGFLAFRDPTKSGAAEALTDLIARGIRTVVVTGDAPAVALAVCAATGIPADHAVTGMDIDQLDDTGLVALTATTTVFAQANPLHKARIVRALRAAGHTVGYLGDGINDTPALRAADVGLAVADAVGVARQAADAVLLDKDLRILARGVVAARRATVNATKYLKATLSANLGNVLSVLAAGMFLPILPMLPLQLLAQNLCYDLAQLALPLDRVDPDQLRKPQRWSTRDLLGFIACFAPLSSLFDLATFWLLGHLLPVDSTSRQALFHTCWFIENLLTQILAVQVIRTAWVPLRHSRTTAPVALAAFAACGIAILLPYTPAAPRLGLQAPSLVLLAILAITATGYLAALQVVKVAYRRLTGRWL
jgi:Mg2+-importing ATPase